MGLERARRITHQRPVLHPMREDHTKAYVRKILTDSGESRCQVSIAGNQSDLANLELVSTTGRPLHTQGNLHVSLFFLKLPDCNLILPGSLLPLDQP